MADEEGGGERAINKMPKHIWIQTPVIEKELPRAKF